MGCLEKLHYFLSKIQASRKQWDRSNWDQLLDAIARTAVDPDSAREAEGQGYFHVKVGQGSGQVQQEMRPKTIDTEGDRGGLPLD